MKKTDLQTSLSKEKVCNLTSVPIYAIFIIHSAYLLYFSSLAYWNSTDISSVRTRKNLTTHPTPSF